MTATLRSPVPCAWSVRIALGWISITMGLARLGAADLSFFDRLLDRDVDLVVVTDTTADGRKLPDVTPAHPVYYELIILGYKDYGRELGDAAPPDRAGMLKALAKMLADRGYLHAEARHPPQIAIALAWGTMNARRSYAVPFMGGDKLQLRRDLDPVEAMITPYSLRRKFWTPLQEYVVDCANGDLYVISIWGFDLAAANQGKSKLLWQTKVACPAGGLEIGYALERMSHAAVPYIARETPLPVRVTAPRLKYEAGIGELQTIEFLDPKTPEKTIPAPAPKPGDGVRK